MKRKVEYIIHIVGQKNESNTKKTYVQAIGNIVFQEVVAPISILAFVKIVYF
jgi:hypothetical protein